MIESQLQFSIIVFFHVIVNLRTVTLYDNGPFSMILFCLCNDITVQLPEYPFKNGQRLEVVVTEVLSPWEFWVQPVGSELDLLMEEMW